jgi:hypothetical protein
MNRRGFLAGLLATVAVPAIIAHAADFGAQTAGRWFLVRGFDQFGKPIQEMVPFPGQSKAMFRIVSSGGV